MSKKELYHPYVNDKGKKVSGIASLAHYISQAGGIQNYNDEVGSSYIKSFVKLHKNFFSEAYMKDTKKKNFKVI